MLRRFLPDPLVLALVGAALVAVAVPARGEAASAVSVAVTVGVMLVFFLHGARLVTAAVIDGLRHWRLHLAILACTFALFPLLALASGALVPFLLPSELYAGFLFLSILPSTLQSAISFTSIAGGNVPAAVCATSASNLVGVVLTPLLAGVLLHAGGVSNFGAVQGVVFQLLLPFLVGQGVQPWVGGWMRQRRRMLGFVERGSMLLVVYAAFSSATVSGVWSRLRLADFAVMALLALALLAIVVLLAQRLVRRLGLSREDEIAAVFCGSNKSIGSGLPMANILFAGQAVGLVVLPMILYHQIQGVLCALLAARYARAAGPDGRRNP